MALELNDRSVRISVRRLVEFLLRSGDLDNRITGAVKVDAMAEGSRIHRKIQKAQRAEYRAEVPLKQTFVRAGFDITVEGRADGIFPHEGHEIIDEIKGVYTDVLAMEAPVPVHLAQAKCYALFYAMDQDLAEVGVRMTYCNLDAEEEIRFFEESYSVPALAEWFEDILSQLLRWVEYLYEARMARNASIRPLEFPFPYRNGQRDLAVSVYRTAERERRLFIQAPTGIGKTMSVLYPSVKAVGEGLADRIFYLTAKTITRTAAEEALRTLREKGLSFSAVTLTAKEKMCILEKPDCNPVSCPRAKGHFDRVGEAVYDVITHEKEITRDVILTYAEKHQVCPFEFSLDITDFCDGIIGDYNYAFDPDVRLDRFFADAPKEKYIFLIDEAHNLPARAREMYSASLTKEDILAARRLFGKKKTRLTRDLDSLNRRMLELKRCCTEEFTAVDDIADLIGDADTLYSSMQKYADQHPEFEGRDAFMEFYFELRSFLNTWSLVDEHYRIYSEIDREGKFVVRLFCVNPVRNLGNCLEQASAVVFFSATLIPLPYYRELLSNQEEDYTVYVNSPFPQENRLLLLGNDVTSRYRRRGEDEYRKIAEYIRTVVRAKRGNYIVFFPSYFFMEQVADAFGDETDMEIVLQSRSMGEQDREAFLQAFEEKRTGSFAAFCVMGGIFSEGIDLTEERLIGTVIVGTGLPMVCTEQKVLQEYFDRDGKSGFAFAYQYPGMTKVLQAAGRVIRTMKDRGVIVLLDDRFTHYEYRAMFPREWNDAKIVHIRNIGEYLERFWRGWERKDGRNGKDGSEEPDGAGSAAEEIEYVPFEEPV